MSNLRCKNYGLSECTWIEAKLKAGKIMAALSTTTSVVAALQTIEIIKLAVGCEMLSSTLLFPSFKFQSPDQLSVIKSETQTSVYGKIGHSNVKPSTIFSSN
jgi:hypothetical protein